MEYDNVLKKIGEFGKYQRQVYFTLCLVAFPATFNAMGYVFWAARPDHWCHVDRPHRLENMSDELWKNWTIPPKDTPTGVWYDSCSQYNLSETFLDDIMINSNSSSFDYSFLANQSEARESGTVPCDSWDYDTGVYTSSIVNKYTLVCGRQWLISMTQSLYMASRVIGTLGLGAVADRLGRRPVFLICILLQVLCASLIAFAPNVQTFILLRCLCAVFSTGSFQTLYVFVMEIVGPSWRVFAGTVIMIYWAVAYMMLALIAYLIRDHFTLMLVTSVPFILMLGFYWIMPESPRWLLVKNRKKAALAIITKMAKTNGADLPDTQDYDIVINSKDEKKATKSISLCDTCKSPYIWRMTLVLIFIWFTNSVVYYGLSLNTSDLGGNDHLNFFISGAVEIPAYVICYVTFHRFGRQWPLTVMTVLAGLSLLATAAVPTDNDTATVILASLGKFAITCTYSMIYIFTTELYPTSVRNITLGVCSTAARLGATLAPFAIELSIYYRGLPLLIFGILATVASVLVLTLPETKGTSLPQTLEDGRMLARQPNVFTRCIQKMRQKKKYEAEKEPMSNTKI